MEAYRAPGRVNLIGEHVDYAGGLVLPAALECGVTLVGEETTGPLVRIESEPFGEPAIIDPSRPSAHYEGWARYVAAVISELVAAGIAVRGFTGALTSDLPAGSGLSSSAALEVCLAGGLARASGVQLDGMALARLAQRAEHRAVGVPCGIMDQAASSLGVAGHALLLDCASLDYRQVPMPANLSILVIDSGVRRRLEDSAYAERRREVELALQALPVGAVRDWEPERVLRTARGAGISDTCMRRLRHVVSELPRVRAVVAALERSPAADEASLGESFAAGHASLRDDFEVSVPELDLLVELAREEGAIAARMTGGGFGGAIVALAQTDVAKAMGQRTVERYVSATGRTATLLITRAGAGSGTASPGEVPNHTDSNMIATL